MQSLGEFKEIYTKKFQPILIQLDYVRYKILLMIALSVICAVLLCIFWASHITLWAIISLSIGVISGLLAYTGYAEYRVNYKLKIVLPIIASIDRSYKYFYDSHISPKRFLSSGLYKITPDRFRGDDLIQGTVGDIGFEMSEMKITKAEEDSHTSVFNGLFIVFDLPLELENETYILPNNSDLPFGFQSENQGLRYHGKRISFADEHFNHSFSVFGFNEEESRRILRPKAQIDLRRLAEKIDKAICVSFKESQAYCTITFHEKLFEPKLFEDGECPSIIKAIHNQVSIVEELGKCLSGILTEWDSDTHIGSFEVKQEPTKVDSSTAYVEPQQPNIETNTEAEQTSPEPASLPPPTPKVNLKALYYDLFVDQQFPADLSLKNYLLSMINLIRQHQNEEMTHALAKEIMLGAVNAQPAAIDSEWQNIRSAPDPKVKYQKTVDPEALEAMTVEDFQWGPVEFSLEVLGFQVAELEQMEGNQLDNPMKEYGISSPSGTPWYNFTVQDNVEAGLRALIEKNEDEITAAWSLFGVWMQYGRAYE